MLLLGGIGGIDAVIDGTGNSGMVPTDDVVSLDEGVDGVWTAYPWGDSVDKL